MNPLQRIVFFFFCLLVFQIGCKTLEKKSNSQFEISFGSGGGVTGKYIEYRLNSSGELYKYSTSTKQNELLKKIELSSLNFVMEQIEKEKLMEYIFYDPGNLNKFFEIKFQGKTNKILWSKANKLPKDSVLSLYDKLNTFLK